MTDTEQEAPAWDWSQIEDHECSHCGANNPFPAQPPEELNTRNGVVWECNGCGGMNKLGGVADTTLEHPRECAECHATYDNRPERAIHVELDEDGSFTCPVCNTRNVLAEGQESAYVYQVGEAK